MEVECGQTFVSFESRPRGKNVQVHIRGCWPPSILEISLPTSSAPQLALCPCDSGSCCSPYTLYLVWILAPLRALVHSWVSRPIRQQELGGRGGKSIASIGTTPEMAAGCWVLTNSYTPAHACICSDVYTRGHTHTHLPTYHRQPQNFSRRF